MVDKDKVHVCQCDRRSNPRNGNMNEICSGAKKSVELCIIPNGKGLNSTSGDVLNDCVDASLDWKCLAEIIITGIPDRHLL